MIKNNTQILLLAFRKSHKLFFTNLILQTDKENFDIRATREMYALSFKGIQDFKNVNLSEAITFAVDEFYAKTEFKIPRFLLTSFFTILAYINYLRYYEVLTSKYHKVLIWNGGKFRQRIAIEIAKLKGIEVYFYENGLLPERIVLDAKGINYGNSVPRKKSFYEDYINDKSLPEALIPRISKHKEKFSVNKIRLTDKMIFIPFQVDYDTQIISQSPWIKDMRALFSLIESIAKNSPYQFILKEHPSSAKNYPDLHEKTKILSNVFFANGYKTQELIEKSVLVITINSTVGIESLLFHKKVIVLGNAFYSIEGISWTAKNKDELIQLINRVEQLIYNRELVNKFLKYLYYDYLIPKDENMYQSFASILLSDVDKEVII